MPASSARLRTRCRIRNGSVSSLQALDSIGGGRRAWARASPHASQLARAARHRRGVSSDVRCELRPSSGCVRSGLWRSAPDESPKQLPEQARGRLPVDRNCRSWSATIVIGVGVASSPRMSKTDLEVYRPEEGRDGCAAHADQPCSPTRTTLSALVPPLLPMGSPTVRMSRSPRLTTPALSSARSAASSARSRSVSCGIRIGWTPR